MKLDRNLPGNRRRGKYALLKLRRVREIAEFEPSEAWIPVELALDLLVREGIVDWGDEGTESEFFLMRLKDKYAQSALYAYAEAALEDDSEYANEVVDMAKRSGMSSPWCKRPD